MRAKDTEQALMLAGHSTHPGGLSKQDVIDAVEAFGEKWTQTTNPQQVVTLGPKLPRLALTAYEGELFRGKWGQVSIAFAMPTGRFAWLWGWTATKTGLLRHFKKIHGRFNPDGSNREAPAAPDGGRGR